MRVLLITDWNPGKGGAELHATLLRDGLRDAGDEVRLLTSSAGTAGDGSAEYVAYGTTRLAQQAWLQLVNPSAVATVVHARREFRPEAARVNMFAHYLSPALIFALGRVPTVLTVSDYKCACPTSMKLLPNGVLCGHRLGAICWHSGCVGIAHWMRDQPRYALIRAGMARARRIVACGEAVRAELALTGIEAEVVLPPVLGPGDGFRRAPSRVPLFVFCGRLDRSKGASLLLRAFRRLTIHAPQARLRFVGEGPERGALERETRETGLGDAVSFCGWVEPQDVERHLEDAWALVAPSLWAEPFGMVAAEAIMRSVPVVASRTGGFCESVEDGVSGLLFRNNDEDDLHRCLALVAERRVFQDHALPPGVVGRARDAFSVERHVARMRTIFAEVASNPGRPRVESRV